ncbi:unnamed protein product [Arabidopsis lyrata]|nr:unnamed protein product [Arabidopsis lyrata]
MEIPVIEFGELDGENRSKTMALLDHACDKWGFFMVDNHGIDKELMEKVKKMINSHYEVLELILISCAGLLFRVTFKVEVRLNEKWRSEVASLDSLKFD